MQLPSAASSTQIPLQWNANRRPCLQQQHWQQHWRRHWLSMSLQKHWQQQRRPLSLLLQLLLPRPRHPGFPCVHMPRCNLRCLLQDMQEVRF